MLDIESERFQSSLGDVIHWCAIHHRAILVESPEATDRRRLYEQAHQLFAEARTAANRWWLGKRQNETDQWKNAQQLLSKIGESYGSLERRLRHLDLMPSRSIDDLKTESDWSQAVSEVVNRRRELIDENPVVEDSACAVSGRLLKYFPLENLADGAAHVSSFGFYDWNNVPAWDIWVAFSNSALFSWVPSGLIEAAQMGIDVNPENCIRWAQ